ncbi:MAG: ribbon-helix-helix protein, CopG family [Verrucomicrobia bacterium]|nr:ribbon-helix-helix protein, CopG family [Verrucomicrobiota bacterium]
MRLRFRRMGHTITVRVPKELAKWLEETAATSGISQGRLIREQLEKAKAGGRQQAFMRLAGAVQGAVDLSSRKGFSKP